MAVRCALITDQLRTSDGDGLAAKPVCEPARARGRYERFVEVTRDGPAMLPDDS